MKFKILFTTVLLLTSSMSLFAKTIADSVGVKNDDGKKMIVFKIKSGDTYYSIGKRYHVKSEAIMRFNGAKKATLTIGKTIEVPTDIPFKKSDKQAAGTKKETAEKPKKESADNPKKETKKAKSAREAKEAKEAKAEKKHKHKIESSGDEPEPVAAVMQTSPERVTQQPLQQQPVQQPLQQPVQQPVQQNNTPPIQYKVSAGETLYAIGKRFNTTVDDITTLNNLTSTTLQPGQILLVRSGAPVQQPTVVRKDTPILAQRDSTITVQITKDSSMTEHRLSGNRFGLFEKNEKGVATWMDDPGLDPNKKLVLHRSAPIGTVIKITNPMTNRTTFAKVVGRFTDNAETKDVIIVMSKNVADALGAPDKRFRVDISYGSPSE